MNPNSRGTPKYTETEADLPGLGADLRKTTSHPCSQRFRMTRARLDPSSLRNPVPTTTPLSDIVDSCSYGLRIVKASLSSKRAASSSQRYFYGGRKARGGPPRR